MTLNQTKKFDFDDILIEQVPISDVDSRYKDIVLPDMLPLFTAPMDSVVNYKNIETYLNNRINVCTPRTFLKRPGDLFDLHMELYQTDKNIFIGMGLEDIEYHLAISFQDILPNGRILIDVANGAMQKIILKCIQIKKIRPDIVIMVGNIANPETYKIYAENECCDYIRVGIGNGSNCTSTKNGSIGFPQASLISEIYQIKQNMIENNATSYWINRSTYWNNKNTHKIEKYPKIVADGGLKDFSDIIKAYNLGADYCMVGGILNRAIESAGYNYFMGIRINQKLANLLFDFGFTIKKYSRGMSTKAAQKAMGKKLLKTSEGVIRYRKAEYHLDGWVENFDHYLRTAMSYSGCRTLDEFIGKNNIIQITEKAYDRFNK